MLTKLVVGILKKYDIYHTRTFSTRINQKTYSKPFIFSLDFWHNNYSLPLQNSLL
jgi:hypothetical protein